jgi:superfamily II DNA or RNA helicase
MKRDQRQLTLKDRLSHLTYQQACKLLGAEGGRLIQHGGAREVDIDRDVRLQGDLLRVRLNGAVVTITTMAEAPQRLHWNCTQCNTACEHVGAAMSLILEEKTTLGLAAPPPDRVPMECFGEQELVRQAVEERAQRARAERMTVRSMDAAVLWTDYLVTSAESGKTYRVALRGWQPGESYCSCPDFRKNTLGVCKHIFNVQRKVKGRFSAGTRNRRHRQKDVAVHLHYGRDTELRLLVPEKLDGAVTRIVKPLRDTPIDDVHDLLRRVQKLSSRGCDVTIYPDAEEYIERRLFLDRIKSIVAEIRQNPGKHALRRDLLKADLLPYQLDGIAFAVGAGRAILADDMGLGKTIQGIGVAELLARQADISRVLVICPATLKSQWRSEVLRFSNKSCQLVLGSAAERARQYDNGSFFTICNYEQVLRDILAIEAVPWDLIVLDEGQRIKNWDAQTSRIVKSLKSPFALVLTGTPLENRLDDLYSVTEFIDDRRLGPAFRFFNRHRVVDENGKVLGYKNLAKLRDRLKPVLLRRTRASVMRELPPRSTEILRVRPTDEQNELHIAHLRIVSSIVRKPYFTEMDVLRLRKALLMCRMAADSTFLVDKREPSYSSKLETLDDLLGTMAAEKERKAVLFSEWTTMLNLIEPLMEKHQLSFVRLDGSVPQKKRRQLVQKFQDDPSCRLFITTNAGSTGLNLQAADTVINVDLPWNPAVLEQRIARAHRMGQKRPVQVYVLVTEGTIEESLLATLSAKHELALAALDVESDVDAVDVVSNADDLKRRMEILLGARPDATVDESQKAETARVADRLAHKENVAAAGGQLLGAAFSFLSELMPNEAPNAQIKQLAASVKQRLDECMETDNEGRLKLTVTLPDSAALDRIADSLARLLSNGQAATMPRPV